MFFCLQCWTAANVYSFCCCKTAHFWVGYKIKNFDEHKKYYSFHWIICNSLIAMGWWFLQGAPSLLSTRRDQTSSENWVVDSSSPRIGNLGLRQRQYHVGVSFFFFCSFWIWKVKKNGYEWQSLLTMSFFPLRKRSEYAVLLLWPRPLL